MQDHKGPPTSEDNLFWWDGKKWQLITPARDWAGSKPGGTSAWTIARGVVLAFIVIIAALWILNGLVHSNDGIECVIDNVDRAEAGQPALVCPQ